MRTRKRRRQQKSGRLVLLLLVAGLLAIGCGWLLNRLIVQGYLWSPAVTTEDPVVQQPGTNQPDPDPDPGSGTSQPNTPTVTEASVVLAASKFHLIQVGALSSDTSAQNLIRQLAAQGYPGAYTHDDKYYRVFAGIYPEQAAADVVGQSLEQLLKNKVFVKEVSWSAVNRQVTGSLAGYFAAAKDPLAAVDHAFATCLAAEAVDQVKIADLQQQVDAAHQALSALTPPAELQSLHATLLEACTDLLATANQIKQYLDTNDELELLGAQSSLMDFAQLYQQVHSIVQNILT